MQIKKTEINKILKKHENHIRTEIFIQNIECVNKYEMISEETLEIINMNVSDVTEVYMNFGDGKEGLIELKTLNIVNNNFYNRISINKKIGSLDELKTIILKKITDKNIFY